MQGSIDVRVAKAKNEVEMNATYSEINVSVIKGSLKEWRKKEC